VKDGVPTASSLEKRNGKLAVGFYHPGLRRKLEIDADLVVLATPLIQREDAKRISQLLKVPLGQDGFFFEAHVKLRPVDFATDGIFMAGSCRAPAGCGLPGCHPHGKGVRENRAVHPHNR